MHKNSQNTYAKLLKEKNVSKRKSKEPNLKTKYLIFHLSIKLKALGTIGIVPQI